MSAARPFTVSLRALLAAMAMLCTILAAAGPVERYYSYQYQEYLRLEALCRQKGGYVRYLDGIIVGVSFTGPEVEDSDIETIDWSRVPSLCWVEVHSPHVTDAGLRVMHLDRMSRLHDIETKGSKVTWRLVEAIHKANGCRVLHDEGVFAMSRTK